MTEEQSLEKLYRQADLVGSLKQRSRGSAGFKKWHRDTEVAIEKIFGEDTRHVKDFAEVKYSLKFYVSSTPEHQHQNAYVNGLDKAHAVLLSFIDEINEYGYKSVNDSPPNVMNDLEEICQKFHLVSRQIRQRYNSRATIEVEDEYDVQDLLHALLLLKFDDVRREEWTPSYAGGCSRVDFLIKSEKLVIEVKKTRQGLKDKDVGEQLVIDIQRYRVHPDCETLFCFVYDPEGRISNPRGLENDLNGDHQGVMTKVMIAPSGI